MRFGISCFTIKLTLHIPDALSRRLLRSSRLANERARRFLHYHQVSSFVYHVREEAVLETADRVTGENRTHDEWITTTCLTIWRRPQWLQGISKSRPTQYECVALPLSYGALRAVFNLYKTAKRASSGGRTRTVS